MHLSRFPRQPLAHLPTPLEPLDALRAALGGGPRLWIKRDDCTGLATGGNKTRKLEYLCAEAQYLGADTLVTQGATQSNHCRQTAAAAARLGMRCVLLLERRVDSASLPDAAAYEGNGNVLLDGLLGAEIRWYPSGGEMNAELEVVGHQLREAGRRPYLIPGGGSNPRGALGYVHCALELQSQALATGLRIDHVVHATGSTGTQAGLVVGFQGSNSGIPVLGVSVRHPRAAQEEKVHALACATAELAGVPAPPRESVVVDDGHVGGGYGVPTPGMREALSLLARHEGILLDPVYSGKGMAGLVARVRAGAYRDDENVVFVHTGGSVGLFGYVGALA